MSCEICLCNVKSRHMRADYLLACPYICALVLLSKLGSDVLEHCGCHGCFKDLHMDQPQLPAAVSPVPVSVRDSFRAWLTYSQLEAAEGELYLFARSGYFAGAQLGNCPATDILADAYDAARGSDAFSKPHLASRFATIGTRPADDGKVGFIRPVDIGSPPRTLLSWLFGSSVERLINTVEIGEPVRGAQDETSIVIVHGYGAGAAFFFRNMQALAALPKSRLYALDWLGMGRSSRPGFPTPRGRTTEERMRSTEDFFLESLEQWRVKMNIERMVLVGHSLGGYISTVYALRYPERVSRLILLSPAGFSRGSLGDLAKRYEVGEDDKPAKLPFLLTPHGQRILTWAWGNISPFALVRSTGMFGPWMSSKYTRRRFADLDAGELRAMHAYCHGVFSDRASSEKCRAYVLTSSIYSRPRRVCTLSTRAAHPVAADTRVVLLRLARLDGSRGWARCMSPAARRRQHQCARAHN